MIYTHDDLVRMGRTWLSSRSPVVLTEIKGQIEEPDVIGFNANLKFERHAYASSVVIECKAGRSDFKADAEKIFRRYPEKGMGTRRFFLVPEGLISLSELPERWGLLEARGKRIRVVRQGVPFDEKDGEAETRILVSALRRLVIPEGQHVSLQVYKYQTKCTASLTVDSEIQEEVRNESELHVQV